MKGFLYGKTEYSFLSPIRIDQYIEMAKKNHFDFLTITDPNMYGVYKFYKKCIKSNIKPIIGLEYKYSYLNNDSKLILYAKNNNGYIALNKISMESNVNNETSLDILKEYKNNLIIIFPFLDSILEELLYKRQFDDLDSLISIINDLDGYIGISYTNKIHKFNIIKEIEEYINNKKIKTVNIHECNYLIPEDKIIYEALNKINQTNLELNEYDDYSFLVHGTDDDSIDNLINEINLNLFNEHVPLPSFPKRDNMTSKELLIDLCNRGLVRRKKGNQKKYIERLNYELDVISKMGFCDYFLIVWDFIRYAKQNNIFVGPGRGSAAGSLVAYTLGIVDVDPLEYNLLFERFLNPGRSKMPDIDTDFPDNERFNVIEYVKNFYGENSVCGIVTFDTFQIKSAIRDLVRITDIEQSRVEKIIEMVNSRGFDYLLDEYKERDRKIYNLLYIAKSIQNLKRHTSVHPAGIIISNLKLTDYIPLTLGTNGIYMSQFEEADLTEMGFLKMDFLGIRYLSFLSSMANELGMKRSDVINLRLDDRNIFRLLEKGDTLGIFQLESKGIRRVLIDLKPKCFSDIVAVNALYRPGPMDDIPTYIRRHEGEKIVYPHSDLEPILKDTYGIIVYQEQIMQIAQKFAGFSLSKADIMRRAISKKDSNAFLEIKNDFIKGSLNNGYNLNTANYIYDLIIKFADYGFNKSHSVVYSMVSYYLLWFKAYHRDIFIKHLLNEVRSSSLVLEDYIKYAKKNGIEISIPDINKSNLKFDIVDKKLYFPLTLIFSLGNITPEKIIEERKNGLFKSFKDFRDRCDFVSKNQIEALIYSGAFDSFNVSRKALIKENEIEAQGFYEFINQAPSSNDEFSFDILALNEKKYLGINLLYNIFTYTNEIKNRYNVVQINDLKYNNVSNILCYFSSFREIKTKKNETMYVGNINDENNNIGFVIFPSSIKNLIIPKLNNLYIIRGTLKKDNKNEDSFSIYEIIDYQK